MLLLTMRLNGCRRIISAKQAALQRLSVVPVVVFSDNSHFQVLLMNAVSKMVTLTQVDPFGNDFPTPVRDMAMVSQHLRDTVKDFF